jgi:hypothetical protein
MRITLLRRGGVSVYGASYDARRNVVVVLSGDQVGVEIIFPDEITAIDVAEDGIDATTPVVTGNKATFTMTGTGSLDIVGTMGVNRPRVRIEAETDGNDRYGDVY